jgi:hypothetical protein
VGLYNESSSPGAALGLARFITVLATYLVTLYELHKSDLLILQIHLRGEFVEQKLNPSYIFKCDQAHDNDYHEFGHSLPLLLKSGLYILQISLRGGFAEQKLKAKHSLKCDQAHINGCHQFWSHFTSAV